MSSDGDHLDTSNSSFTSVLTPSRNGARLASNATAVTASTVRPRNRRLISFVEDDEDGGAGRRFSGAAQHGAVAASLGMAGTSMMAGFSSSREASPSPYASRTASPAPMPRRQFSRTPSGLSTFGMASSNGWPSSSQGNRTAGLAADLLGSSWSSIQGLASAVLGTDDTQLRNKSSLNGYRRWKTSDPNSFDWASRGSGRKRPGLPSAWGPSRPQTSDILPGSKEDRQALIQSKRRELLLQANGDALPDSQGNYKRRISVDDSYASSVPPAEQDDGDALVYIHQVQPTDSLTGVSIRYGCPLPVLRKANGFWPSDSIQARKIVVLPVASCTLKGRRIPSIHESSQPGNGKAISDDSSDDNSSLIPPTNNHEHNGNCPSLDDPFSVPTSGKNTGQTPLWAHESWVQVDGFSSPVELGRVPKRTLGFFPRARRKSQARSEAYSDLTPTPSEDQTHKLPSSSPAPRYRDRSTSSSKPFSPHRDHQRRPSIILSGPGGVGTLDRNTTGPGPAPDKLNAFVTTHLPNLVIPPQPPQATRPGFGPHSDRVSFDSSSTIHSTTSSTGLENLGGAIEGWFRKVATKAKSGLNELQQPVIPPHGHLGIGGEGDLIELDEAAESTSSRMSTPGPQRQRGERPMLLSSSSEVLNALGGSVRGRKAGMRDSHTSSKDD